MQLLNYSFGPCNAKASDWLGRLPAESETLRAASAIRRRNLAQSLKPTFDSAVDYVMQQRAASAASEDTSVAGSAATVEHPSNSDIEDVTHELPERESKMQRTAAVVLTAGPGAEPVRKAPKPPPRRHRKSSRGPRGSSRGDEVTHRDPNAASRGDEVTHRDPNAASSSGHQHPYGDAAAPKARPGRASSRQQTPNTGRRRSTSAPLAAGDARNRTPTPRPQDCGRQFTAEERARLFSTTPAQIGALASVEAQRVAQLRARVVEDSRSGLGMQFKSLS
jgi:hypothetical protein